MDIYMDGREGIKECRIYKKRVTTTTKNKKTRERI